MIFESLMPSGPSVVLAKWSKESEFSSKTLALQTGSAITVFTTAVLVDFAIKAFNLCTQT